jgi:hypothetical protein
LCLEAGEARLERDKTTRQGERTEVQMTSPPHANGFHDDDRTGADGIDLPAISPNTTVLKHQVREVHALVDRAMENLEQVVRALRYIERDL